MYINELIKALEHIKKEYGSRVEVRFEIPVSFDRNDDCDIEIDINAVYTYGSKISSVVAVLEN